eukprot:gene6174-4434_t
MRPVESGSGGLGGAGLGGDGAGGVGCRRRARQPDDVHSNKEAYATAKARPPKGSHHQQPQSQHNQQPAHHASGVCSSVAD